MQKKQTQPSVIKKIILLFVGIIVLFITTSSFISMVGKYRSSLKELDQKKREFSVLEEKKKDALSLYATLETEEGKELYIREKYRVVKPGEELIILSDSEQAPFLEKSRKTLWDRIKNLWQ